MNTQETSRTERILDGCLTAAVVGIAAAMGLGVLARNLNSLGIGLPSEVTVGILALLIGLGAFVYVFSVRVRP